MRSIETPLHAPPQAPTPTPSGRGGVPSSHFIGAIIHPLGSEDDEIKLLVLVD
jgi:hypothetical protein